jgi:hypothetical protein
MAVTTEVLGIAEVQAWASDLVNAFTRAAASEVLAESEALVEDVAAQMPVDTGWAQSRWGEVAVAGGIWEISDNGLSIEQGSDLSTISLYEYITRLNEGSSQQAPAGFIDAAAEKAGDKLEARLNEIADIVD